MVILPASAVGPRGDTLQWWVATPSHCRRTCGSRRGYRQENLRRQAHTFQHLGKPRVRAHAVQGGIDLDPDDPGIPLVTGLSKPLECRILLAEGRVDAGNRKGESEPALGKPFQIVQ